VTRGEEDNATIIHNNEKFWGLNRSGIIHKKRMKDWGKNGLNALLTYFNCYCYNSVIHDQTKKPNYLDKAAFLYFQYQMQYGYSCLFLSHIMFSTTFTCHYPWS